VRSGISTVSDMTAGGCW